MQINEEKKPEQLSEPASLLSAIQLRVGEKPFEGKKEWLMAKNDPIQKRMLRLFHIIIFRKHIDATVHYIYICRAIK